MLAGSLGETEQDHTLAGSGVGVEVVRPSRMVACLHPAWSPHAQNVCVLRMYAPHAGISLWPWHLQGPSRDCSVVEEVRAETGRWLMSSVS